MQVRRVNRDHYAYFFARLGGFSSWLVNDDLAVKLRLWNTSQQLYGVVQTSEIRDVGNIRLGIGEFIGNSEDGTSEQVGGRRRRDFGVAIHEAGFRLSLGGGRRLRGTRRREQPRRSASRGFGDQHGEGRLGPDCWLPVRFQTLQKALIGFWQPSVSVSYDLNQRSSAQSWSQQSSLALS